MRIRPVQPRDRHAWTEMRCALWPDEEPDRLAHDTIQHFADVSRQVVLVAERPDGRLVGFLELNLRPYAEGCSTSPVPFIEGWYVATDARQQGVGRRLVEAAEDWARLRGFTEIASDTQLENRLSQDAHASLGFDQVERIVCFRKSL